MRRIGWIIAIGAALAGGCAMQPAPVAKVQQVREYAPVYATALAFDPPELAGMPRIDLSRDGRGPAAFGGFDQPSATYYFLRSDDIYSDFANGLGGRGANPDFYQRRAVSETYGVSYH